jgi:threonylcarbamoyladenosine tRNA methylthiotransferase MtaB
MVRVAFHTLGCRLNQFETEGMRTRLEARVTEVEIVGFDGVADLYVINSCAVTARAEQKCRQLARSIRRRSPAARVAVVGCYSQLAAESLSALDEVDVVLGNEEKRRLDEYLDRMQNEKFSSVAPYRRQMEMADEWIDSFGDHSRATLKVQDGCDMRCSFCTIWKARGPSRSREPRAVLHQARHLAAQGYREIVLAGVHLGHYGADLAPATTLVELLELLVELVDPAVRFRLSSLDPGEVGEDLLDLMEREPRLCNYLHLALQSGSDRILKDMRRGYRRSDFERLVEAMRHRGLRAGIGVDIIVGFPGETDEDFRATAELVESSGASFYHVFRYSERPGSGALRLADKVPGSVSAARSARLREQGMRARREFLGAHVGREVDAIAVAEPTETARYEWMLADYATAWAASSQDPGRAIRRIRIESLSDSGELLASLVEEPVAARCGGES